MRPSARARRRIRARRRVRRSLRGVRRSRSHSRKEMAVSISREGTRSAASRRRRRWASMPMRARRSVSAAASSSSTASLGFRGGGGPHGARDGLQVVRLQPRLHARSAAARCETEPPLAVEREAHEHVLEAPERPLAVDRRTRGVPRRSGSVDGRDEALHPAVLLARRHRVDAEVARNRSRCAGASRDRPRRRPRGAPRRSRGAGSCGPRGVVLEGVLEGLPRDLEALLEVTLGRSRRSSVFTPESGAAARAPRARVPPVAERVRARSPWHRRVEGAVDRIVTPTTPRRASPERAPRRAPRACPPRDAVVSTTFAGLHHARPRHVRLELHHQVVGRRAAVHPHRRDGRACVLRHREREVGDRERDAVERRAREVRGVVSRVDAPDQAPRVRRPVRRAQTRERGDEDHLARVGLDRARERARPPTPT
jgi:hypothetical protein